MECSHEHAVRAVIDPKRKEHKDWISTVRIDIPSTCRSLLELGVGLRPEETCRMVVKASEIPPAHPG
jgi:hypothetical protein